MPCEASLSFADSCTRSYLRSVPPFILISIITALYIPWSTLHLVQKLKATIKPTFSNFLSLTEAEALIDADVQPTESASKGKAPFWRTLCLSSLALGEAICWLILTIAQFVTYNGRIEYQVLAPFLSSLSWLLAAIIPVIRPRLTTPYDLFTFYTVQLVSGVFQFGTIWYDRDTIGIPPNKWNVLGASANLTVVLILLMIVLRMPLVLPSEKVAEKIGKDVSPEDYTPLWQWITFEWVYPMIRKGTNQTLNEPDVWELSPTLQSKPLYLKFAATTRKTLLRRLWAANSLDLILDFFLTFVSILLQYASPFFLKRILDSLNETQDNPEARSRAYIYAFLAFLSTLLKGEADLLHLWYGRRAATRVRSELMASIYAKALVRKDYSGIIVKQDEKKDGDRAEALSQPPSSDFERRLWKKPKSWWRKSNKKQAKEAAKNTSGADVGKIVQLMSGDATRISNTITAIHMVYGAPFEILVASVFLYQLLGLSAFAGFFFLVFASPLNSYITRRSIKIQRDLLAARDKRMNTVNELLNAVKLVKFYGWENRWIDRVLTARNYELKWLVKSRINQLMFSMLWVIVPILVSVVSFLAYVLTGHELTVPVAFTSIALFNMLRAPLNTLPAYIVQILQSGVVLDRIATFLNEDEVSEDMSTLKQGTIVRSNIEQEQHLGIKHASFKWNEIEEKDDTKVEPRTDALPKSSNSSNEGLNNTANDSASIQAVGERHFELRDVNIIFPDGKLTVVTGPTASGKTALLMALLGEMTMLPGNGEVFLPKHPTHIDEHGFSALSYAAQSPFLQHQTIRDNVLFGTQYDEKRYEDVLECCALKPDLEILEDGDMTEIGSRGISLSGGQKARVALARAVYARSKYVLLDDPLSAVDSHTALFLYERLLKGPLLANRTVVLVTHNVELVLPGAYYLVRILDGRIDVQGTTEDLREQGVLETIAKSSSIEHKLRDREPTPDKAPDAEGEKKTPRQLVKDEAREEGSVKWGIYKAYMKASSYWTWATLVFFVCLHQLLGISEKLWIKQWGEAYNDTSVEVNFYYPMSLFSGEGDMLMHNAHSSAQLTVAFANLPLSHLNTSTTLSSTTLPSANEHPLFYVAIYAAISFAAALISTANVIIQYVGGLRASRLMFKQLLVGVVRATMRWHDSTPTGRMLNRFSKDIETVDTSLGFALQAVNSSLATFFASVVTVVFFSPPFIIPAILIGYIYYQLGLGYLNTGRDLRRMESNSRSPIFSNFSELLAGIVTVRAFSAERRFLDDLHIKIDATTKMWYTFWMTNRWLLLHFDFLGGLAVLFTTLLALSGAIGAGLAGVTITSAMAFTSSVYWTCRFWTELELALNSVERVVEYLEVPQEPPIIIESNRPPAYWPSSSANDSLLVVDNLEVRYAPDLPPVLHDVSFSLRANERVGLLGRTGSGKSTLAMSILRFADPSKGSIMIDGIDISTIGLHDLRSRLTFVAQDTVLFSGTIRDNIDPFGEYSDEECLDALVRVHLSSESARPSRVTSRAPSIRNVEREETLASSSTSVSLTATQQDDKQAVITLETEVSAGGSNFSQGQRQLLTMARALLRQSSIIILDEATSSIDFETDAKIQKTIRDEFKNSLLLTVAHRLRTIIDYDRLIVLDNGRIVEFDTPYNLIHKEGGVFRDMCLHSGTFKELEEAANKAVGQE